MTTILLKLHFKLQEKRQRTAWALVACGAIAILVGQFHLPFVFGIGIGMMTAGVVFVVSNRLVTTAWSKK
jgi:hypothetical protein